jgi:hypothetical protein
VIKEPNTLLGRRVEQVQGSTVELETRWLRVTTER